MLPSMFSSSLLCVLASVLSLSRSAAFPGSDNGILERQAQPAPGQLRDFAVYPPVLVPEGTSDANGCIYTKTLMEYTFANSYGSPFVGNYTPPPCDFNRVVMNLTVTSQGVQFDRLALMYLGDVEVFRTSTAEPTRNGIIWNYLKEMQMYNTLWKQPQKIIFDLGNIVNDQYTGPFQTTLTATFFTVPDSPATADQILPITSRSSGANKASAFSVPDQNASVAYTLPKDVTRAVVALSANGQSNEEFWYSDAPTSEVDTFASSTGSLIGGGTFREVQLYIDGKLSGVTWPFPVIFTGGIVPGFWRPIFGIEAIDLAQHEVDITPWLGYLLDGKSHTFEIRVASVSDDGKSATLASTPGSYWVVTGAIFLYRDPSGKPTTGTAPTISTPPIDLKFSSSYTKDSNGTNNTLTYSTNATRSISIKSQIKTAGGSSVPVSWTQKLTYTNQNYLTDYGLVQLTIQGTQGNDIATGAKRDGTDGFTHTYSYPLTVNSSYAYTSDGGVQLFGSLTRGKQFLTLGNPIFPSGLQNFNTSAKSNTPTVLSVAGGALQQLLPAGAASYLTGKALQGTYYNTTQIGSAGYQNAPSGSYTYGTTEQWLDFRGAGYDGKDADAELYNRHVKAVNATIVEDETTFIGRSYNQPNSQPAGPADLASQIPLGVGGVRQFLGRGPGQGKPN